MSIPTSGTYNLTIVKLNNDGGYVSIYIKEPLAKYTIGQNGNTLTENTNVTFNGSNFSYKDSDGQEISITYQIIAGQGQYQYGSVIVKDANSQNWYLISNESQGRISSGDTLTHQFNDNGDWNYGVRNYKTSYSSSDFSAGSSVCFLRDTQIQTPDGYTLVQDLKPGDQIIAHKNGVKEITAASWVGKANCVVQIDQSDDMSGYPVRILKDAISDGVPFKDMLITAEHCLFFDGKFVPARMLVNGRSIFFDKSITHYDYYHVETEEHSVIMADGMLTESYLDTGNRRSFTQKGNVVLIGGSRDLTWDDAAAPLTVSRETIEPIFRRIEARANMSGIATHAEARALTHESNLHLTTNTGVIIRPTRQSNGRIMFMIPEGVESVRIASHTSRPCDVIGPFVDDRRQLGVLVGEITLFESNTTRTLTDHLHDTSLSGWNDVEEGTMRWTNGNAMLPLGKRAPGSFALMAIEVRAAGPYILNETVSEQNALKA